MSMLTPREPPLVEPRLANPAPASPLRSYSTPGHVVAHFFIKSELMGLSGVHVLMASAILIPINFNKYTIIDFWELGARGITSKDRAVNCIRHLPTARLRSVM
jgi:hypothetical protein